MGIAQKIVCLVCVLGVWLFLTGCHTIQGAGEDIEQGGRAIQRAVE